MPGLLFCPCPKQFLRNPVTTVFPSYWLMGFWIGNKGGQQVASRTLHTKNVYWATPTSYCIHVRRWIYKNLNPKSALGSKHQRVTNGHFFIASLSLSHVWLFATLETAACQASLSTTNSQSFLRLMSIESVLPSKHLILCCLLLLLPSIFPSIRVFYRINSSLQVAKVLRNQLQHQSFQWIFRTDFLQDWLVWSPCSPWDSQESSPTPQFKVSVLLYSAFFVVQLSHPYMTTGRKKKKKSLD